MGRVTRFTPLPDEDVGPVHLVVALDGGFVGLTAIKRDRLRDPVTADRLRQKPERRGFIPVLRAQEVNSLAVLIPCSQIIRTRVVGKVK
jgi:hypothetical protein